MAKAHRGREKARVKGACIDHDILDTHLSSKYKSSSVSTRSSSRREGAISVLKGV